MGPEPEARCHLCGGSLYRFDSFGARLQVTSDCRPWQAGGRLAICETCATVQRPVDAAWSAEAEAIYAGYAIYDQSAGAEQQVFDADGGRPRSSRIVEMLEPFLADAAVDVLDIGCGNGGFLRALSSRFPASRLSGTEFDTRNRAAVLAIPGTVGFYTGGFEVVPGHFDLISMIHVLEHIVDPVSFLRRACQALKPGGKILIQVPDRAANAFDVLIADHCTHFDLDSLRRCCRSAALEPALLTGSVVPKELTCIVTPTTVPVLGGDPPDPEAGRVAVTHQLAWLDRLAAHAREAASSAAAFGLFGSSISGTWLDAELGRSAAFFVDEDPSRIGRRWMGRPILAPADVAAGATVFVPLIPAAAARIAERLGGGAVRYEIPDTE